MNQELEENTGNKGTENSEAKQAALQRQINVLLSTALDSSARERLSNVRLVNPELYLKAIQAIAVWQQQSKNKKTLTESDVKNLLLRLKPEKKAFSMTRK